MEFFNKNIKYLRNKYNMSQSQFGKIFNKASNTITQWENGTRQPKIDLLVKIAEYFNISLKELMDTDLTIPSNNLNDNNNLIAIYGYASCGQGKFNDDEIIGTEEVPNSWIKGNKSDYFLTYACGDSMIGASIPDGALLFFKKTTEIENGQIGAFCLNDEAYIKRFKIYGEQVVLQSENSKYEDIVIKKDDDFRIVGKLLKNIITYD